MVMKFVALFALVAAAQAASIVVPLEDKLTTKTSIVGPSGSITEEKSVPLARTIVHDTPLVVHHEVPIVEAKTVIQHEVPFVEAKTLVHQELPLIEAKTLVHHEVPVVESLNVPFVRSVINHEVPYVKSVLPYTTSSLVHESSLIHPTFYNSHAWGSYYNYPSYRSYLNNGLYYY